MPDQSTVALASRRRALLTLFMAIVMLAFNYGSLVRTASDAAAAGAVFLGLGYPTLTAVELLFDRLLWRD